MASAKFQSIITLFTEDDSPRVWSLLVTMFGDLAQEEGHTLSGGLLGRMTQSVGIKPEATRVALHRLRKEGWLNSERSGRTSAYSLTEWGRAETIAATPIIYAFEEPVKAAWLVIPEVGSVDEAFAVAPNIFISSEKPTHANAFVQKVERDTNLPEWMKNRLCHPNLVQQCQETLDIYDAVSLVLPKSETLSALEIAVLRVLVVHNWRRIVLRIPRLPDYVFPASWTGPACRTKAQQLLNALPAPALDDLGK